MNGDAKRIHSGSDHRIYRFHFGWSTRARSNHFNLTSRAAHQPPSVGGTDICNTSARDSNPPLSERDRAPHTTTEPES